MLEELWRFVSRVISSPISLFNIFCKGAHFNSCDWILYLRTTSQDGGVDFGINNYNNYRIVTRNIYGKTITSISDISSSNITMDLNGFNKGIYFVQIINKETADSKTHKVVIQ